MELFQGYNGFNKVILWMQNHLAPTRYIIISIVSSNLQPLKLPLLFDQFFCVPWSTTVIDKLIQSSKFIWQVWDWLGKYMLVWREPTYVEDLELWNRDVELAGVVQILQRCFIFAKTQQWKLLKATMKICKKWLCSLNHLTFIMVGHESGHHLVLIANTLTRL
jgi:hypothetical protein